MNSQYIIVGGGTAGCFIANKLSKLYKVLLLEQGGVPNNFELTHNIIIPPYIKEYKFSSSRTFVGEVLGGGSSVNGSVWIHGENDMWLEKLGLQEKFTQYWSSLENLFPITFKVNGPIPDFVELLSSALKLPIIMETSTKVIEGIFPLPLTSAGDKRVSSYSMFIQNYNSPNLDITTNCQVQKIEWIIDDSQYRATRLLTSDGYIEIPDKLVLSAGTYCTPHLLLKSGIVLPGIGKGLQDHSCLEFSTICSVDNVSLFAAFFRSDDSLKEPDFQMQFGWIKPCEGLPSGFFLQVALLNCSAIGSLSGSEGSFPNSDIEFTKTDVEKWKKVVPKLEKIFTHPLCKDWQINLDKINSYLHPVGTCAIDSLVDKQTCLLNGTKNIYICDASLIPTPTCGNPQSYVYALAMHFLNSHTTK